MLIKLILVLLEEVLQTMMKFIKDNFILLVHMPPISQHKEQQLQQKIVVSNYYHFDDESSKINLHAPFDEDEVPFDEMTQRMLH